MKTYDVTFQREDYKSALDAWTLVDDVVAGQRAVKARGREYLPKPSPKDLSADNTQRFTDYLFRAIFYNATGRTLQGLVGAAFRKDPELNVPASLDYVKTDIDGAGVSIYQQSQSALRAALTRARNRRQGVAGGYGERTNARDGNRHRCRAGRQLAFV